MLVQAKQTPGTQGLYLRWESLGPNDEPEKARLDLYPRMTVTISGGPATLYGMHEETDPPNAITDIHGFVIKAPGIYEVTMNPRYLYPKADAGPVTVAIWATK